MDVDHHRQEGDGGNTLRIIRMIIIAFSNFWNAAISLPEIRHRQLHSQSLWAQKILVATVATGVQSASILSLHMQHMFFLRREDSDLMIEVCLTLSCELSLFQFFDHLIPPLSFFIRNIIRIHSRTFPLLTLLSPFSLLVSLFAIVMQTDSLRLLFMTVLPIVWVGWPLTAFEIPAEELQGKLVSLSIYSVSQSTQEKFVAIAQFRQLILYSTAQGSHFIVILLKALQHELAFPIYDLSYHLLLLPFILVDLPSMKQTILYPDNIGLPFSIEYRRFEHFNTNLVIICNQTVELLHLETDSRDQLYFQLDRSQIDEGQIGQYTGFIFVDLLTKSFGFYGQSGLKYIFYALICLSQRIIGQSI